MTLAGNRCDDWASVAVEPSIEKGGTEGGVGAVAGPRADAAAAMFAV